MMLPGGLLFLTLGLLMSVTDCQDSPQLVILVADNGLNNRPGAIYKLTIQDMNLTAVPIPNVQTPVGITYDKNDEFIYWTDSTAKHIRRADMDGLNDLVIANISSASIPAGITLDSNTRQVFYTDQGNNVTSIVRIEVDTFKSTVIVNTGIDKPRGIVADTTNRILYWVDWGTEKIETCDYNGDSRRVVVSSGLVYPCGITLDEQAGRLFWADCHGVIESVLINGKDRKILHTSETGFLDIALFNGFLYFTVRSKRGLYSLTEDGKHLFPLKSPRYNPTGVYVFSPNTDITSSCPYGEFGVKCVKCGSCDKSPCEKTTGICYAGCSPGYTSNRCTEDILDAKDAQTSDGELPKNNGSYIGLIIGVVAAVTVANVFITVMIAVWLTRRHRKQRDDLYVQFDNRNKEDNNYRNIGDTNNAVQPQSQTQTPTDSFS